jgi:hypothetical protein
MDLPIACTLTEAALRERRQATMNTFREMKVSVSELTDGYVYSFEATSEALLQIAHLVDMERQCCPFLTFKIVVENAGGPIRLEIRAPEKKAKSVIAQYFPPEDASAK